MKQHTPSRTPKTGNDGTIASMSGVLDREWYRRVPAIDAVRLRLDATVTDAIMRVGHQYHLAKVAAGQLGSPDLLTNPGSRLLSPRRG